MSPSPLMNLANWVPLLGFLLVAIGIGTAMSKWAKSLTAQMIQTFETKVEGRLAIIEQRVSAHDLRAAANEVSLTQHVERSNRTFTEIADRMDEKNIRIARLEEAQTGIRDNARQTQEQCTRIEDKIDRNFVSVTEALRGLAAK